MCDAALHLIAHPDAGNANLVDLIRGPDFPTGGVLAESQAVIEEAYATGRGSLRLRARWSVEPLRHGMYQIVVAEIPYQTQKGRLVERIAELITRRRLHMLADVRDESAEDLRLVLEPRSRAVQPGILMEQLFRHTELEIRVSLNMNVLDGGKVPRVMNLRQLLQAFLDHRHDVLVRRTRHRLGKIARRLEILGGYLIAYANLDEVIRVIREADKPKAEMMRRWSMSEVQAEAILDMRLRALRRLEEIEIKKEHKALTAERKALESLLAGKDRRWGADRRGDKRCPRPLRGAIARRRAAHRDRRCARSSRRAGRGRYRARADHCHLLAEGLDPRGPRPSPTTSPTSSSRTATAAAWCCAPRRPTG